MTTTKPRRTIKPAVCVCEAHGRLIYPCDLIPSGVALRVTLNAVDYLLIAHGNQPENGYRFKKLGGDGSVTDVDVSEGYPSCDCPYAMLGRYACKHALAILQLKQRNVI